MKPKDKINELKHYIRIYEKHIEEAKEEIEMLEQMMNK